MKIYVILMNTGTLVGSTIKKFSKYKYSHVVLSLDSTFEKLYSFGRKNVYNFLNGGFITYGINSDFFNKFDKTECAIYEININQEQYQRLVEYLNEFEKNSEEYKYDIKGLFSRFFFAKDISRDNYYVCSNFVASVLEKAGIIKFDIDPHKVTPEDFSNLDNTLMVYEGEFKKVLKNNEITK